jgi:hypothetical protein
MRRGLKLDLQQSVESTRTLLQGQNVIGTLISRLTDSEEEVIVEAAGALRCVLLSLFCYAPSSGSTRRLNTFKHIEICASAVDTRLVQRCTTRSYTSTIGCGEVHTQSTYSYAAPQRLLTCFSIQEKKVLSIPQYIDSPKT